jgi:glyoxylase-like metal-dependent hydrolase (beta-lactamase superfamily II)
MPSNSIHALALAALLSSTVFASETAAGTLNVFTSDAAGFNTHSVWYDDGQEVTVVDTQFLPAIAQTMVAEIRRKTKSPITRVIVTHPNPDKFNALSVFHALGAVSIASAKTAAAIAGTDQYKRFYWIQMAKAFTEKSYPSVEAIRKTFAGTDTITLKSGETITLIELDHPGVSSAQTVVRFDATGDLAVGDLVHTKNHAWLEGGIVDGKPQPDLAGWQNDLQQLLELPPRPGAKIYGGRGEFVPVVQAVLEQRAYLVRADEIVNTYLTTLTEQGRTELSDPARQGAHYKAIQAQFVAAFPDYAMPDLISYSVYGLIGSKRRQ